MRANQLGAQVRKARSWLHDHALPFWSSVGVDGDWGFVEHLSVNAHPVDVGYKRLRVQARQVYVFSHAAVLGYPQGLETAANGWRFMRTKGWLSGGGWARCLGRQGNVIDPTLDLYDQSFALLAIAWWIKASGDDELKLADRTLAVIDERLASPSGVGWLSDTSGGGALLQNPHMHLLEALLALYDATSAARFKSRIEALLELYAGIFFDPRSGTLAEYYDVAGKRLAGERGRIVEPGHHYEWVWLLHQAERVVPGCLHRSSVMFEFAERFGSNPATGLIYDELLDDGTVRTAGHRCWPHAEALKAQLARFEHLGTLNVARTTAILDALFSHFLKGPVRGTWIDRLDESGKPRIDKVPTSTFYHVFLGFAELLRLEPQLRSAGLLG